MDILDGKQIKELMDEKGMTQKQLALKTGLTESSISRYINGSRYPSAKSYFKIIKAIEGEIYDKRSCKDEILELIQKDLNTYEKLGRSEVVAVLRVLWLRVYFEIET